MDGCALTGGGGSLSGSRCLVLFHNCASGPINSIYIFMYCLFVHCFMFIIIIFFEVWSGWAETSPSRVVGFGPVAQTHPPGRAQGPQGDGSSSQAENLCAR